MTVKKIVLIGSTGSIGKSTLEVASHLGPDKVQVVGLIAHTNVALLEEQVLKFHPKIAVLTDVASARLLKDKLKYSAPKTQVLEGMQGVIEAISEEEVNCIVSAMVGSLGLIPTLKAISLGKTVALANKEALVAGGSLVMNALQRKDQLLPVDSEHNALFQCLLAGHPKEVSRLILTASGGPFRNYSMEELLKVTKEKALNHPTWKMGPKITVDSSTLMNKGLEVIEAYWLFDLPIENIEVAVHPESIIHSMVEFKDGSIMAEMNEPSMVMPIQYALTYPHREKGLLKPFDFKKTFSLNFMPPDLKKFRCLALCYEAIKIGGTMPAFMNALNELLVDSFLKGEISWIDISLKLEKAMEKYTQKKVLSLEDIFEAEREAKKYQKI